MANQVAYGFNTLQDVFARRVTEIGVDVVADAIQQSVDEHNRQMAALLGLYVEPTQQFKIRYTTPVAARLQPLDESGRARPLRIAGYYDIAFPLQMGGAAWGGTFLSRAKLTVEEANQHTLTLLSADMRWVRDHVLAALFASTAWTFTDEEHGSLTVQGLANGDTVQYLVQTGADTGATDTHYLAQANAIADGADNPFPAIYSELNEHPENGGEVVAFVPTNLKASVEALTLFRPVTDPNVQPGANTDVLVGSLGVEYPGTLFGYVEKVWVVEWKTLPDDYIIATTTDGDAPLCMREDAEEELRGFRQVASRDDHPFYESQWMRRAGFGAKNRVGALVKRIGNAAYAVPTNYGSPMP